MARSENQKLKTLYVAKYFMENSDENHPISAGDIIDYLEEECGITADRRSIYRDIAALRDVFGMDIEGSQGTRYRLMSRQFEYDDLYLLAECVHAAKFISAPKAKELIGTISEFCSIYQAERLQNDVYLCDRVKTTQKGILNIISTIRRAMARMVDGQPHMAQKISFKYMKYTIDDVKTQVARRSGKKYVVSPYNLLINDGNYYLIAYSAEVNDLRTYRVDRMKDVELVDECIDGYSKYRKINMSTYTTRVFSMFTGEPKRVSIQFENKLLDTVIERFGTGIDTFYRPEGAEHFVVSTDVEISDQFFGWLCGFGTRAKLIAPESAVAQFKEYINDLSKLY